MNKFTTPEALARCESMGRLQSVLGGKWKILILWYVAFYKVQRFGELRRRLEGITQSTLTKQLRELEEDGFLHREVFGEVPPRWSTPSPPWERASPRCFTPCWSGAGRI